MRNRARIGISGVVALWAGSALAGDGAAAVGHGKIDYTAKTVTATGSGAPNLKAGNVAVARLGAERAAKMDALRNILEAVKGVRVSSNKTAGKAMEEQPEVKARVEGIVKDFKVLDTKYYSDGGVDVIVQVPLDGVLTAALLPQSSTAAATPAPDPGGVTGVIVNAKGLGVMPALAPRLLDDAGKEIYSAAIVTKDAVNKHGIAGYTGSLDGAMKDNRVTDKPLIVRAAKLAQAGGSDLVLSADDAAKIAKLAGVLADAKLIIVTD
ncbi:MAG: LPP20 family lipoprotein [Deltaproteobacteria bacterium]|nr:LPP20 family lipoprotein [Deltaproteobacteria bacterium]